MGLSLSSLGAIAGGFSGIPGGSIIGGTIGGMLDGNDTSGLSAYGQQNQAAAQAAADAAKFKPYSLTTGFGKSFFDTEKQTAGYDIDPRLAAFRDQLYGQAEQALGQLGSTNPQAEAQKYVDQQMGLLAPTRQAEDMALRQKMLGGGRIGLGLSSGYVGGDGQGLVNPDQFGLNLARERANAEIGAAGTAYGQNMIDKLISRGTGLFTSGAGIEQLGMSPLTMGADLGKAGVASGNAQGQALLSGGQAAANANLASSSGTQAYNQELQKQLSGLDYTKAKKYFSGLFTSEPEQLGGTNY
jgi:hypothetical protein